MKINKLRIRCDLKKIPYENIFYSFKLEMFGYFSAKYLDIICKKCNETKI